MFERKEEEARRNVLAAAKTAMAETGKLQFDLPSMSGKVNIEFPMSMTADDIAAMRGLVEAWLNMMEKSWVSEAPISYKPQE